MPLRDDNTLEDVDGTELIDVNSAREHASGVARELMFNSTGILHEDGRSGRWSCRMATAWSYLPSKCPMSKAMATASDLARHL